MRNHDIEQEMYRLAVELIEKRYPTGWGGAGVVHTASGSYFTSVSIDTANASAILCIETGAMLEAHKYNEKVTHCMCLIRDDEHSPYRVLSPMRHLPGAPALLGRGRAGGRHHPRQPADLCGAKGAAALPLDEGVPGGGAGALGRVSGII